MPRITQDIAKDVARKLLVHKKVERDNFLKEYQQLATDEYRSYIPLDVLEVHKKHPEWSYSLNTVTVHGNGFNSERIGLTEDLPSNTGNNLGILPLTSFFATKLVKYKNKYLKANESYSKILQETESALLTLATFKRVEENFPEAYPFLPSQKMPVIINLDHIRKQIK